MDISGAVTEDFERPVIDREDLDKKALPKIKEKVNSMNLNEGERKPVIAMLAKFYDKHNLHILGMAYLKWYERTYRGTGAGEIKRVIPCPYCKGENTRQLTEPIAEVFRRHLDKRDPAFGRMMDSPKITREWNEIDFRGNNKKVHAEYRCCVRTHDCIDCNTLFSYPDITRATLAYFRVESEASKMEKIRKGFPDAKEVGREPRQNF